MSEARNYCVARGNLTSGFSGLVYRVPPGYNLILKSIVLWPTGTPLATVTVAVYSQDASVGLGIYNVTLSSSTPNLWSNWMVLNAGDFIDIGSAGGASRYWVSGALLAGGGLQPVLAEDSAPRQGPPVNAGPPGAEPQRVSIV